MGRRGELNSRLSSYGGTICFFIIYCRLKNFNFTSYGKGQIVNTTYKYKLKNSFLEVIFNLIMILHTMLVPKRQFCFLSLLVLNTTRHFGD